MIIEGRTGGICEEKRWGKVWGIQFLLLTLRSNLRGIYILRREIEKFKLHIISYGKKHI